MPDGGPYGPKHVAFIDDIIKMLCLTVIYVYANINMSHHSGMEFIKMNNDNMFSGGRIRFTVRLNVNVIINLFFLKKKEKYGSYNIHSQENAKFNSEGCFLSSLKHSVINCHLYKIRKPF